MWFKQLRASTLAVYNACPYKYKNTTYDLDPAISYFGTIIHFLIRNDSVKDTLLDYYNNNINPDLQLEKIWHKLVDKARKFVDKLEGEKLEEFPMLYKLPFGYDDTWFLEWTADLITVTSSWKINIYDYKTSSSYSWYDWEEIWKETPQGMIYAFLASKIFKVDEIEFTYIVLEKKNKWLLKTYSKIYNIKEIENKILNMCDNYISSELIEDYEARPCRFCNFCPFKNKCPAFN